MPIEQGGSPSNPDPATETKQDDIISELQMGVDRYYLEISKGNITGTTRSAYGGGNTDLSSGDGIRDIWNGPGNRTVLGGATQLYISSTNAGDNAVIGILGMDADYNENVAIGVLNGQNQVAISALTWKTWNFFVLGIGGTYDGTIYLAESNTLTGGVPDTDAKIQLVGPAGFGAGAICNKTVPAGHTLYVLSAKEMPNKGKDVTVYFAFESNTQARVINPVGFELYENNFDTEFRPPFALPEKTDLMFLAKTRDTDAPVSVLVESLFVSNT